MATTAKRPVKGPPAARGSNGRAAKSPPAGQGSNGRAAKSPPAASGSGGRAAKGPPAANGSGGPAAKRPRRSKSAKSRSGAASDKSAAKPLAEAGHGVGVARRATGSGVVGKAARAAIGHAVRRLARQGLQAGGHALARFAEGAGGDGDGGSLAERLVRDRPPVQRAVDVAVPVRVAWREWMALERLPEGTGVVTAIERDGDGRLTGRVRGRPWEARVLDQRPEESFAWQSKEGSDCAGLLTFHELGERLTRIELSLDLVPRGASDALLIACRSADRRAEAELRRFKARVELISPDAYDQEEEP